MIISVLNDNRPGEGIPGEFGFSIVVQADKKILMDAGQSDIFQKNAGRLGVSLDDVDAIVLSHRHADHSYGLEHMNGGRLVCHPDCFEPTIPKGGGRVVSPFMSLEEAGRKFELTTSREPVRLSDNIYFLGEIPRNNDFEAKVPGQVNRSGADDFIMDDSGLAITTEKGLVVISGCAHAGICNTIEHAKKVAGDDRIFAVIGGFHLVNDDDVTSRTIGYLKSQNPVRIMPGHCVSNEIMLKMHSEGLPVTPLFSGTTAAFPIRLKSYPDKELRESTADMIARELDMLRPAQQSPPKRDGDRLDRH
ncbi:MAG: MBL fold metallo-hydrolase [Candidatus Altiarchaeota archaeon]